MTNPTTQAGLQFTAPYNILPDRKYRNPTVPASAQFTAPYNILPDPTKLPDPNIGNPLEPKPATTLPGPPPVENNGIFVSKLANAEVLEKNAESAPYRNWTAGEWVHTNVNLKTVGSNVLGFVSLAAGSLFGIPQIGQVGQNGVGGKEENDILSGTYTSLPFDKLKSPSLVKYSDFRSRVNIDLDSKQGVGQQTLAYITSRRVDGFSAALRGSVKAAIYSAAAVSPIGPYSIFNLDGVGFTGYGYGEHDHPDAIRKDFTMRSHISTRWIPGTGATLVGSNVLGVNTIASQAVRGRFARTNNPAELATPFRGDKVNVVDFGKRRLKDAYLWNPDRLFSIDNILGMNLDRLGMTQDFIKFYLTGPKLQAGSDLDMDDIMVFRATIQDINDSHGASWSPQQMIGRADPNYIYTGYSRDLSISFDIYATDRDEMQPIYRKLNALAGYTAPTYNPESIAMEAPWLRITIGDLFVQTPVVLKSVGLTFGGADSPWEVNIEDDPNMMQAPLKIGVSLSFNVVSDYLPQQGGRFYTLAKRFSSDAQPLAGNDNWLSDSKGNLDLIDNAKRWKDRRKKQKTADAGTTTITNT
jgi:hypothetical protein